VLCCGGAVSAQIPGGFPGGPGGAHPFDDALINAPIEVLTRELHLSAVQRVKIAKIQTEVHRTFDRLMRPGDGPPDFAAMRTSFDRVRKLDADGTAKIKALLTPAQRAALPATLKKLNGLNASVNTSPGIDLYVLVKKLNRVHATAPFTAGQAEKLSDLLEPLFEQPDLNPADAQKRLQEARSLLTPEQTTALAAIHDITAESVLRPTLPAGGPPAAPGGFPGGPFGGPPGGFPGMNQPAANPRFNPFYNAPGVAIADQAGRDLRALLDLLDGLAGPTTVRPAAIALDPAQAIDVTTFHYDVARTGWNPNERILTPRLLEAGRFGRLWHTLLDGQVYAAPLVVSGKSLGGSSRDLVIAPTENNTVYALDAETGEIVWQRHLATPLSDAEYNDCINISPLHGITSTPVIDLNTKEIYVCGLSASRLKQLYSVWALDLATGAIKDNWPVTLAGKYAGLAFDGGQLTQRGALSMVDGWLYIPFASRCDIGEWHGWVMGVNAHNPTAPQRAFTASPDTSGGGMWGSAGLAADADGNLYAVTGNGDYNLNEGGKSIVESILRMTTHDGLAFSYQPKDYYVPANHEELDRMDADLGGSSAIVVDHPGSATPHLLFTGGKDGYLYLVDRDNLGGVGAEIQKDRLFGGSGGGFYSSFIKTTPATFQDGQGTRYIVVTGNDKGHGGMQGVVALKLGLDDKKRSHCTPAWSAGRPLYQPGSAVVSSNGAQDGIVWVIETNKNDDDGGPPGVLHAYSALTGKELYRSSRKERRDSLGDARKFSAPTVANGRVYCGTDGIVAYGPIEEDRHAQ
jgi:hypothetical protein